MLSISYKRIPFQNQESFYSKQAKIYSYWIIFDSQRMSEKLLAIATRRLLLKTSKFLPVFSFLKELGICSVPTLIA